LGVTVAVAVVELVASNGFDTRTQNDDVAPSAGVV